MQTKANFAKDRLLRDLLLAIALILVALSVFFILRATRDEGETVVVTVNGETVAQYPLSQSGEYSINGGTNILKIEGGEAYILDADCPDLLCVRSGKISLEGDRVVCLPNRVMIEIRGADR